MPDNPLPEATAPVAAPATRPARPPAPAAPPDYSLRGKALAVFLNATACYLLTYQVCALVFQYATVNRARHEHVLGRWTTGGVHFTSTDNEWDLQRRAQRVHYRAAADAGHRSAGLRAVFGSGCAFTGAWPSW